VPVAPREVKAADAVLRVASSQVELPIAVELPAGVAVDAALPWRLVEEGSDAWVHAQIGAVPGAEGAAAADRQRVLAVIPPGGDGVQTRSFRLTAASEGAAAAFEFRETSPTSLELGEGGRPVFVYHQGVITREDLPQQEHRRSRSCYIHPLYGLSGEVLTDDFPRDHYHHHGVWWAWPHVLVDQQGHSLWDGSTIKQTFHKWLVREAGPVAAVLAVENGWYVGDELVMVERIWTRTYRAAENDRALDLEMFFTPAKPMTLQGAEGKSYGGLTIRFAPRSREETLITAPSGPTTDDLPDTPLAWADYTSRFGDMPHPSGVAMLVSPRHPDYPPTWLTRYYGAMCIGWPGITARSFDANKPFRLDYRLWLHRERGDYAQLQQIYQGYTQAVDAQWACEANR